MITGIDGKKIHNFSDLQEALTKYRPGDKIKVTVVREKKTRDFDVTLKNSQGNTKVVKDTGMDVLGAAFRPITDETKKNLQISAGLEVTGLSSGKMQSAGVRQGFIILRANGDTMREVSDLEKVMKTAAQSPEQVIFISGIYPSGRRANYAVDLSEE